MSQHPLTALVTGAGGGIGCALTTRLLRQGYRVLATDCTAEALTALALAENENLATATLDVTSKEQWNSVIDTMLSRWQRLDVLFNIAGVLHPGHVAELSADFESWVHRHVDINLKGTILGTHTAACAMREQGGGHIVNMSSLAGISPVPGLALYAASKFGVRGFSLSAALELRKLGIFVTVVCPDAVATPMLDKQLHFPEAALTFSGARRALTADDIAKAVVLRALRKRPLELTLPGNRGFLARMANFWPALGASLEPWMSRKGLRQQELAKKQHKALIQ